MAPFTRQVTISPAEPLSEVVPYSESVPGQGEVTLELRMSGADGAVLPGTDDHLTNGEVSRREGILTARRFEAYLASPGVAQSVSA
jgi:hypothetical protein